MTMTYNSKIPIPSSLAQVRTEIARIRATASLETEYLRQQFKRDMRGHYRVRYRADMNIRDEVVLVTQTSQMPWRYNMLKKEKRDSILPEKYRLCGSHEYS